MYTDYNDLPNVQTASPQTKVFGGREKESLHQTPPSEGAGVTAGSGAVCAVSSGHD